MEDSVRVMGGEGGRSESDVGEGGLSESGGA